MMEHHFIAYLYRLRYIKRWSLMRNTVEENVAEHSFHVAVLTHLLCTIGNEKFSRRLNVEKAVTLALFHDATEVFTGDIPTPVKHQNANILSNFRAIERGAADRLGEMIPNELQAIYKPLISGLPHDEQDAVLLRYVKAADLLEAYIKCATELSAGNREFTVAQKQIKQSLDRMELPELDYFLATFFPSIEKTIDELTEVNDDKQHNALQDSI